MALLALTAQMAMKWTSACLLALSMTGEARSEPTAVIGGRGEPTRPNILLILADDVGVDRVAVYGEHPDPGRTPVLDELARNGILFRNTWVNPVCSPTRSLLLTGRYGFRTGIGTPIFFLPDDDITGSAGTFALDSSEISLPRLLTEAGYHTAAIGKWHLANNKPTGSGYQHPIDAGFEYFAGSVANANYFGWEKNTATAAGNAQAMSSIYPTTENVDDTLAFIRRSGPTPWFVWLAFNAAHKPFHAPPAHLIHEETQQEIAASPTKPNLHRAMVEAMDTEIGRLLRGIPPDVLAHTLVIFIGDNGTPKDAISQPAAAGAKGSVLEGGLNVPFIMAGAHILAPGREEDALVSGNDLHATVLQLAGVHSRLGSADSVSLTPYMAQPDAPHHRRWVYAERFKPNGFVNYSVHLRAMRGERYKLIRNEITGTTLFYNLLLDPNETLNLLGTGTPLTADEQTALQWLQDQFLELQ
jgi:arylsulfatase B